MLHHPEFLVVRLFDEKTIVGDGRRLFLTFLIGLRETTGGEQEGKRQ
jgi:hypothetical protein